MFIINYFKSNYENDWNKWQKWQLYQNESHFKSSDIIEYYTYYRKIQIQNQEYNKDFGQFSFLFNTNKLKHVLKLIIDIYDHCKGYTRYLSGDPDCINWIKIYLESKKIIFTEDTIKPYMYNYNIIHSHTVALYSLSTLLFRISLHHFFINNKISWNNCIIHGKLYFDKILLICSKCEVKTEKLYGENKYCFECYYC